MPVSVSALHALSMTTPFDALFENNATNWNSGHLITADLNIGATEISGLFSNANGLSFGLSGASITGSYTVPSIAGLLSAVNLSAGATSNNLSAFTFSNASGVSFGLNGSVVTASVKTDYQTAGAYLTTAMLSNRGSDFVQAAAAFAGTNASGTIASGGISVSVLAQTNQTVGLYASSNTYLTSSGTVDARSLSFRGDKSITVGVSAGEVMFSVGAYLTTAALSNHSHGVSFTSGSTVFQTLSFTNSNGISFNSGTQGIFGSHNAITTGRASTDAVGLNTAQTGVTWTVNSSGISINAGAYLTTAMLSNRGSDFVQAAAGFNGTNASGTIASNAISVSVAAQSNQSAIRALGVSNAGNTAGNTGVSTGIDWVIAGTNNVTASQSTVAGGPNTIWLSAPAAGGTTHFTVSEFFPYAQLPPVSNSVLGQSTLYFSPFDVPVNVSASRINFFLSLTATWSGANTRSCSMRLGYALYTRSGNGSVATLSRLTSYECPYIILSGNSSTVMQLTMYNGLSNATSHSTVQSVISDATVATFISNSILGFRELALPLGLALTPGRYWLGVSHQTASSNASAVLAATVFQQHLSNQIAFRQFATSSAASNASFHGALPGLGTYSAVSAVWPVSIPISSDSIRVAPVATIPYFNISGYSTSAGVL